MATFLVSVVVLLSITIVVLCRPRNNIPQPKLLLNELGFINRQEYSFIELELSPSQINRPVHLDDYRIAIISACSDISRNSEQLQNWEKQLQLQTNKDQLLLWGDLQGKKLSSNHKF